MCRAKLDNEKQSFKKENFKVQTLELNKKWFET